MTPAEYGALIEAVAAAAKKHGLTRVKVGDVELDFSPAPAPGFDLKAAEAFKRFMEQGVPTEEDILMHSVAGYVPTDEQPRAPKPPKARGS